MADIDQLSIGIEANSKKADKAIDDLCEKLLKLKTALSVGTKMTDFDNAMKSISTNMDSVSDSISRINTDALKTVSKNFNNLAKSISKLATSSEKINFNGATSSANTFIQVAKQGAQEVSKQFGITDTKAIERLEKKFIELADAVNKNSTTQHTIFDDIIDDVKRSKNVIDKFPDEYKSIIQSIQNANKNFKVKLPFSGNEFTNDFSTMRSTLGKAFTSTGNITNAQTIGLDSFIKGFNTQEIQTINSVIQQMGGIVGDTASQFAALVRIKEEYNKATQNTGAVERSSMTTMNALENTVIDSVSAFNNLTRALGQVEINEGKTTNLFQQLANSLNSFSSINLPDMSNLSMLADSIAKFGYKSSTKGAQNLQTLSHQLPQLVQALNSVGQVTFQANGLVELANAISKLGGKKATSATANIPTLVGNLHQLISEMNQLQSVSFNTESLTNLASAIAKLGGASVGRAITNLPLLTQELMKMMQTLSKAPAVSQNLINMTTAMGNLHGSARNLTSGTTRNGFKNLFNEIFKGTNKSSKGMKSLAYYFGKFYANFWLLRRGFSLIKGSIDYASDLIEVQNVVDNSFGKLTDKVEEFAKGAIESYGMSELTAKQISSRFQAMGNAMEITNAQVEASNKTWKTTKEDLIDVSMAYNNTAESMADVSLNLTKLAADIGSFYNEDYDVVAEKLQSVFTGQTRPLREYGIDLTQATIKEWALTQGIEANFKAMTQAEKTMLRYQYVMAHTEQIQNDFIRTQGTWANSTRILKQNLQNLGATIGGVAINAFRPLLAVLNSAIIRLNEFATTVANALGRIFGWTYEAGGGGSASTGLEDIADSANDIADGMGNAADEAERAKQQLQGFDKLNNLSSATNSGSGSSGSGSGSSSGVSSGGATSGEWVRTDPLFENYMSDIESLGELGEYISGAITDSLNGIEWDDVYEAASDFGTGLATFLNGLINPELFSALGQTVADSINTVFEFLNSFGDEFEWDEFGESLGTGLNSFMEDLDWDLYLDTASDWGSDIATALNSFIDETDFELLGETVANFVKTGINAWYSFVTTFDFSQLGQKIADAINGFLEKMQEVDSDGLNGWQKLGQNISNTITGIADVIITALDNVDWQSVGQAIGDFLGSIDWTAIALDLIELADSIFDAIIDIFHGWSETDPKSLAFVSALGAALAIASLAGVTLNVPVILGCAFAWEAGFNLGEAIGRFIYGDEAYDSFSWTDFVGLSADDIIGAAREWFSDIASQISEFISNIFNFDTTFDLFDSMLEFFGLAGDSAEEGDWLAVGENILAGIISGLLGAMSAITEPFTDLFNWIWDGICNIFGIHSPATEMEPLGNNILLGLVEGFVAKFDDFKEKVEELPGRIIEWFGDVALSIGVTISETASTVVNTFKTIWDSLTDKAVELVATATEAAGSLLGSIKASWDSLVDKTSTLTANAINGASSVFDSLKNLWSTIKSKTSKLTAKAVNGASSIFESLQSFWTTIKSKKSTLTAKAVNSTNEILNTLKNAWTSVVNKTSTLTAKAINSTSGILSTIKTSWSNITTKTATLTGKARNATASVLTNLRTAWGDITTRTATLTARFNDMLTSGFRSMVNGIIRGLNRIIRSLNSLPGVNISTIAEMEADGGAYHNGMWHNIRQYASGTPTLGLPTPGSLFIAGEAGAEIVANSSRGTEVLNESQIAQSIAIGVNNANARQNALIAQQNSLLAKQNELLVGIYEKTGISDKDIFESVRRSDRSYQNINGHTAFGY